MDFTKEEKDIILNLVSAEKITFDKKKNELLSSIAQKIIKENKPKVNIYLVGSVRQAKRLVGETIDRINMLADRKITHKSYKSLLVEHVPTDFSLKYGLDYQYPVIESFISMSSNCLDGLAADNVYILYDTFTKFDDDKVQRALYLKNEIMGRKNNKGEAKIVNGIFLSPEAQDELNNAIKNSMGDNFKGNNEERGLL